MSLSTHQHGYPDNSDQHIDSVLGLPVDDPRLGATPEEIAYYNKLEEAYPQSPLDVTLAKISLSSSTQGKSL